MDNRILTIDSLIEYCKKNKLSHYSSKESGKPIIVNTFGNISYSEASDPSLMSVTLKACHCGINRNNSKITEEVMMNAFPTFANKPILAEIVEDDNGEKDFGSHSFTIESDENGNQYTHYIEKPVGIVPETNNIHLEYDKKQDKTYTIVNGYIFNYYGNETADIIKRKNGTKVSVELEIYDMAWSGKDKVLVINDFSFAGITLLGESVGEGMLGSRLDISDFSKKETIDYSEQLVEMQERLEKLELACFNNTNNSKEGGNENLNKFDELCQKYGKTVDDITFDYENMSDDELVEAFAKAFDETDSDDGSDGTDTPSNGETTPDENEEGENNPTEPNPDENGKKDDDENNTSFIDDEPKKKVTNSENTVEYSFTKNGEVKKFAVSLQDKIYAIQDLVNATYAEADNTYYGVTVYDEYVIMCDWWSGRYYKQSYDSNDDNYNLTGDRVEVYAEFVTVDEQRELESMRSNYAELKAFKENVEKNELHSKKEFLLADEKYSVLSDNEAFTELKKNMDNYSLDDLETKAKVIFADYVSSVGNFSLNSSNENKSHSMQLFGNPNTRRNSRSGRYGDIFKK